MLNMLDHRPPPEKCFAFFDLPTRGRSDEMLNMLDHRPPPEKCFAFFDLPTRGRGRSS